MSSLATFTEFTVVAVTAGVVLVLATLVVSGFGLPAVLTAVVTLGYLVITGFVLWLLWRLVQAVERIADATEDVAMGSTFESDD